MVSGQTPTISGKTNALILADNKAGMGMLVRDLLRKFSWKAADCNYPDCTFDEIFGQMRLGNASCIIVDDYDIQPAPFVVRRLLTDQVTLYTPILVLLNESNIIEMESLNSLGLVEVLQKPISFGNFKASFESMLLRWTKGVFSKLRNVGLDFAAGNDKAAIATLLELNRIQAMQPYAAPGLALVLREREEYAKAEKILLGALRHHPKHLGLMVSLVELYLHFGMPDLALKVIASAERTFTGSLFWVIDKLQALLMLNKVDEMIPLFEQMQKRKYATELSQRYLPRCLMAEGFASEFERMIKGNLATKYKSQWSGKSQMAG